MTKKREKTAMTSLHIRLPLKLKQEVERICEANGTTISAVTRLFFVHIAATGKIPIQFMSVQEMMNMREKYEQDCLT